MFKTQNKLHIGNIVNVNPIVYCHIFVCVSGLNLVNSSQWPKMNKYNTQIDDDDVFMVSIFRSLFEHC